jgi:rhodanese-related sulfurtransferase
MRRRDLLLAAAVALALAGAAPAAEPPSDPARQTSWGLYLDAREAAAMKQEMGDAVLFVDVRDPVEAMFTGFATMVDVNVPLLLADRTEWHPEKPVFAMKPNPGFAAGIEAALAARGLDKSAPVILMCRSGGERGAPSAKALEGLGFEKVYVVVDGFEGSTAKDPEAPWRNVDGWKNSGLPWSYKLDKSKFSLWE